MTTVLQWKRSGSNRMQQPKGSRINSEEQYNYVLISVSETESV